MHGYSCGISLRKREREPSLRKLDGGDARGMKYVVYFWLNIIANNSKTQRKKTYVYHTFIGQHLIGKSLSLSHCLIPVNILYMQVDKCFELLKVKFSAIKFDVRFPAGNIYLHGIRYIYK